MVGLTVLTFSLPPCRPPSLTLNYVYNENGGDDVRFYQCNNVNLPGNGATPLNPPLDSPIESFTASCDLPAYPITTLKMCVLVEDAALHFSEPECTIFTVAIPMTIEGLTVSTPGIPMRALGEHHPHHRYMVGRYKPSIIQLY